VEDENAAFAAAIEKMRGEKAQYRVLGGGDVTIQTNEIQNSPLYYSNQTKQSPQQYQIEQG
jgi:hypothetical protein